MTPEEIEALKQAVIATGKCHDIDLKWQSFETDGNRFAKAECSVCLIEFVKPLARIELE